MAVTKTTGVTRIHGDTAVQVLAANSARRFAGFVIEGGPVYYGSDSGVDRDSGMKHQADFGPLTDSIPSTDAYYFACLANGKATIFWIEVSDA